MDVHYKDEMASGFLFWGPCVSYAEEALRAKARGSLAGDTVWYYEPSCQCGSFGMLSSVLEASSRGAQMGGSVSLRSCRSEEGLDGRDQLASLVTDVAWLQPVGITG